MKKLLAGLFLISIISFSGGLTLPNKRNLKVAIGQFNSSYKEEMQDWIQRYLNKYEIIGIDLETDKNNIRIVSIYYIEE